MTTTFLISETKLRQFTDLNDNVDSVFLKNAVREAQDIEIQRMLGTKLYRSLLSQVDAGSFTNSDYETLVNDYVQDTLLYWAYYYSLDALYLRPRNNGILRATGGENSEGVDFNLYNVKRQSVKNKAEWYGEKLVEYLIAKGIPVFPELGENLQLFEDYPDYTLQYQSPIVFRNLGRGFFVDEMTRLGIPITDSAYDFLPPPQLRNRVK